MTTTETLLDRQRRALCKLSKEGWPLGVYPHRVGTVHRGIADGLCELIYKRSPVKSRDQVTHLAVYGTKTEAIANGEFYVDIIVEARLSVESFIKIQAFVEGYASACY